MMDRLTGRNRKGGAYFNKCFEEPCNGEGASDRCDKCDYLLDVCEKLAHYEDMEEQGKLLILPCKPGDTVYAYCEELHRILPYFVEQIVIDYDSENPDGYITINANCVEDRELIDCIDFEPKEVGKIVFLTEQEAKEALEGMKE